MNANEIMKIFDQTAYVRTGGSSEELKTARYLQHKIESFGCQATLEPFDVQMGDIEDAELLVDGILVPCEGYRCAGSSEVEAPFYYLRGNDPFSLSQCKGKIVMVDGYLGYWMYQDLMEHGAVGFITYSGNANYADRDIDKRELREQVHKGNKIPGVNINAKSAISLVKSAPKTAKIILKQKEYVAQSHNVVLDLPGEISDTIVLTAHYDSTPLSVGIYDNMSGSVGLLALAEYFAAHPHRCGLRFVWCGSEERGLLGSKAYCQQHDLSDVVLNINLDMIGSIMGKFICCATAEDALWQYITYLGCELGFPVSGSQGVYSSDSTPFADAGVPSVSLARDASGNVATIHNRYDTAAVMSGQQMVEDIEFIRVFTERMANAQFCPVSKKIPENMKEKLDYYLCRKREEKR